jgi:hypothetical protein
MFYKALWGQRPYTWYQICSSQSGALKAYLELKCRISKKKVYIIQFNELERVS